jgi:hypothetical protein
MSDSRQSSPLTQSQTKLGISLLPVLSLISMVPFALFIRSFIQEGPGSRDWNPAWAGESIVIATGISLGLIVTSPFVSMWMIKRFQQPGFLRRAGVLSASAITWAIGTVLIWGATLLVHGLWVRNLVKFREALAFGQILGGLLGVMLFFTIPLALVGGLLARFLLFKSIRAT